MWPPPQRCSCSRSEGDGRLNADQLRDEVLAAIAAARSETELERIRIDQLGRKGRLSSLLEGLKDLPKEEKPEAGRRVNEAKRAIESALADQSSRLESARLADLGEAESIDVTFPAPPLRRGSVHILNRVQREIETILGGIGYSVETGPEVETDWYNRAETIRQRITQLRDGL